MCALTLQKELHCSFGELIDLVQYWSVVKLCLPTTREELLTSDGSHHGLWKGTFHFSRATLGAATAQPVLELTFQLLGKMPGLAGLCMSLNPLPALCQPEMTPGPKGSGPVC